METINEVIVVEGKNDTKHLRSFFDVETIETHGLGLNKETINFIKEVNNKRGVILLLDPDAPGERIRNKINEAIPNLKNAFLMKEDARTSKKVGVEHASKEVIEKALSNLISYKENRKTLSYEDYLDLGLMGNSDSSDKRERIAKKYHLGKCNAKTLFKRINLVGLSKEDLL